MATNIENVLQQILASGKAPVNRAAYHPLVVALGDISQGMAAQKLYLPLAERQTGIMRIHATRQPPLDDRSYTWLSVHSIRSGVRDLCNEAELLVAELLTRSGFFFQPISTEAVSPGAPVSVTGTCVFDSAHQKLDAIARVAAVVREQEWTGDGRLTYRCRARLAAMHPHIAP